MFICICFNLLSIPHNHTYGVGDDGNSGTVKFGAHGEFSWTIFDQFCTRNRFSVELLPCEFILEPTL